MYFDSDEELTPKEVDPQDVGRAAAYSLWLNAPNPTMTFFKTLDVTNLTRICKKRRLKFNMLIVYCIGKAASSIREFYTLPVGDKLIQYDSIAVSVVVKNRKGEINSCDIRFSENLDDFNRDYLSSVAHVAESCADRDLSAERMVVGSSAVLETDLDGVIGMYSGVFNNPFLFWGAYKKKLFRFYLPVSFQFHHVQMDGAHAGRFLANLQDEIRRLK